jgi:hypothetical protein
VYAAKWLRQQGAAWPEQLSSWLPAAVTWVRRQGCTALTVQEQRALDREFKLLQTAQLQAAAVEAAAAALAHAVRAAAAKKESRRALCELLLAAVVVAAAVALPLWFLSEK